MNFTPRSFHINHKLMRNRLESNESHQSDDGQLFEMRQSRPYSRETRTKLLLVKVNFECITFGRHH